MAIITYEQQDSGVLESVRAELANFAETFRVESLLQSTASLASVVADLEGLARVVEQLQVIGAHAVEQQNVARVGESPRRLPLPSINTRNDVGSPKGTEFRDNADYLRSRLRISRSEARRRISLGAQVLPSILPGGQLSEPLLPQLAVVVAGSEIGSRAATIIGDAIERTRPLASTEDLDAMEAHLARQAVESDVDVLRVVVRRWEDYLDPDGQEPFDETLKVRQGVFLRGTRAGLHFMEISATTQQFEHLMTAMNTATNPRLHASTKPAADGPGAQADKPGSEGSLPAVDSPSHAQLLLEGLVGACRIALTTDKLPAAGGHRPQVMVTINHEDLVSRLTNADRSARSQAGRAGHGSLLACLARGAFDSLPATLTSFRWFSAVEGRSWTLDDPSDCFPHS